MKYPEPTDQAAAGRFADDFRARTGVEDASLAGLLACLGGNSPYLADLALREPATLLAIVAAGPDAVCDQALGGLAKLNPDMARADIAAGLRAAKRAVALAAAVADIGGQWGLEAVTGALSDLAEGALHVATAHLLADAAARSALRLPHPAAPERGSGFVVLAMGKLGARELNFSSDVDLILLYDPDAHPTNADAVGQIFTRLARDLTGLMQARDAGGYVFRVDLRLRPDPASTPPAVALATALSYYENVAQTWERAAFIKARPVAGDLALGRRFLDLVRPTIWRRHLDFAAVADLQAMKQRIDSQRGGSAPLAGASAERLLGHDVKLGAGGIREIEFTAQMLQLVWGGRHPALRVPGTLAALAAEAAAGHLPADEVEDLTDAYRFLRRVEHRLQMVADRQTHALPDSLAGLAALATFLGYADLASFASEALRQLARVHSTFSGLFRSAPLVEAELPAVAPGQDGDPIWLAWLEGRPRALRTERSRALLRDMLPELLQAVGRQADPAGALQRLDDFIWRLPAGIQFFSMLHHNPALLERLADVLGAAPWLADHLASVPSALDGLVALHAGGERPARALAALLRDSRGLDDALGIASRFVRADEFRLAVAEFSQRMDADAAGLARTEVADAVIGALLPLVLADHTERHGKVRGGGMVVVALGKAGSREMMTGSDLDLMLIYDHPEQVTESTGRRPVAASQYFARAAQAVIAALTVPTRDGPLYAVDMRLRPSGNAGPVAVSLRAFEKYHHDAAWTWERLALTRARVVAGPAPLRARVERAITTALLHVDLAKVRTDTLAMRARLWRDLPPKGPLDVKLRAGGLIELEFLVQALQLLAHDAALFHPVTRLALRRLAHAGVLAAPDAALLTEADFIWRGVQGLLRVALGRRIPKSVGGPLLDKLAHVAGVAATEPALMARLDDVAASVRAAFIRHLGEMGAV